jgi:hypothetical protein
MHPAVADSCLHLSAIPDAPTAQPTIGRVPVSLSALAALERRDALLHLPWASTESTPQGGAVLGNTALTTAEEAGGMRVCGLLSKGMSSAQRPASQHLVSFCMHACLS